MFGLIEASWGLGSAIGIVGCVGTSCGLVLEKHSHAQNECDEKPVAYYRQPWWLAGFSMFLAGQILNLIAMSMAPQTVLSCLGAMSLVFNALFAMLILGEDLLRTQLLAMVGVIAGVILVITNTPASDIVVHTGDIVVLVSPLISFEVCVTTLILAVFLPLCWIVISFFQPALMSIFWAMASAVSSGYTVSCFKSGALFFTAVASPLRYMQTYCVLGVAVVLSLLQVHTLNLGLKVGDAMIVVPTYFALGMLAQLAMAEIVFHELEAWSSRGQANTFIFGVSMVVLCTVVMVRVAREEIVDDEETTPGLRERTPLRTYLSKHTTDLISPHSADTDMSVRARYPRSSSISSLSPVAFRSSFDGQERVYTVSVTGPMGIA